MEVIENVAEMRERSASLRKQDRIIGFVPTMGYLHEGHTSLMRLARPRCDDSVISIFVNPTQFGPKEDFAEYPRDMERDLDLAREAGVDLVFAPDVSEMYAPGFQTYVQVESLSQGLCGASRPTFFRGVATVVAKLFNQVRPHFAVFGEKDYQQLLVVKRMSRDLDMDVEIVPGPIVREPDGLAMSSRNVYLSPEGRKASLCLYRSILHARDMVGKGVVDAARILDEVRNIITSEPLAKLDYAEIRDPDSLVEIPRVDPRGVLLLAAWVEKTRLIDNGKLPE